MDIFESLMEKDKIRHSVVSFKLETKDAVAGGKTGEEHKWCFSERVSTLSLDFWAIRPSKFFGARRKAALRIEGYAWAPILGVFDKLREVGDLSYLSFTLYLSVL